MATKATTEDLGDDSPAIGGSLASKMSGMLAGGGSMAARADFSGLDLSKASSGYVLLPEATDLEFVVEKCKPEVSKANNKMLIVTLKCVEPGCPTAKVTDWVTYTGDNPWKFKSLCQATGNLSEDGASFTGQDETSFNNQRVIARITHEVYDGEKRNKIKGGYKAVNDGASGGGAASDEPDF